MSAQTNTTKVKVAGSKNMSPNKSNDNKGFTSVLEKMRGNHDRYISERLRSAYPNASYAARQEQNRTLGGQVPRSVHYETIDGLSNPKSVLNPQNYKKANRFGFAAMHPQMQFAQASHMRQFSDGDNLGIFMSTHENDMFSKKYLD